MLTLGVAPSATAQKPPLGAELAVASLQATNPTPQMTTETIKQPVVAKWHSLGQPEAAPVAKSQTAKPNSIQDILARMPMLPQ